VDNGSYGDDVGVTYPAVGIGQVVARLTRTAMLPSLNVLGFRWHAGERDAITQRPGRREHRQFRLGYRRARRTWGNQVVGLAQPAQQATRLTQVQSWPAQRPNRLWYLFKGPMRQRFDSYAKRQSVSCYGHNNLPRSLLPA